MDRRRAVDVNQRSQTTYLGSGISVARMNDTTPRRLPLTSTRTGERDSQGPLFLKLDDDSEFPKLGSGTSSAFKAMAGSTKAYSHGSTRYKTKSTDPFRIREIITPTPKEASRIMSILQKSSKGGAMDKYEDSAEAFRLMCLSVLGPQFDLSRRMDEGNKYQGTSQAGGEVWVSESRNNIQSVMCFSMPNKRYQPSSGVRYFYSESSWNCVRPEIQDWRRSHLFPRLGELQDNLKVDPRKSIYLHLLYTHPSAQSRGHGEALMNRLKEVSAESGRPFWLCALGDRARNFYRKNGTEEGSSVKILKMDDEPLGEMTLFTYEPSGATILAEGANDDLH